ncbi:MAG: hypothetical protein AAGK97_08290, partial [Bacteroidota bacterium]
EQYILITDPNDIVVEVIQGDSYDFTSNTCGEFKVYTFNKEITNLAIDPVVADDVTSYDCNTDCCDLNGPQVISFVDTEAPNFIDPPDNPNFPDGGPFTEIYCVDDIFPNPILVYTDNCIADGAVDPVIDDQTIPCLGGQITRRWEVADACNSQFLEQVIQIEALPEAEYINPPNDITVECDAIPNNPPPLEYTNGISGSCAIDGFVDANIEEDFDICGGEIRYNWFIEDDCNRPLEYTQIITVNPALESEFIDPPDDAIIDCDEIPTNAPLLFYSNGLNGECLIEGSVEASIEEDYDACGGEVRLTWQYEDDCNRFIEHIQFLDVNPASEADFIDPPEDETITCDQIPGNGPTLVISNNQFGNCLIEEVITPVIIDNTVDCVGEVLIEWSYIDLCGREYFYRQTLTIKEVPNISVNQDTFRICEGSTFNLNDIVVTDINGTNATLTYHDASPPNETNQITNLVVNPLINTSYFLMLSTGDGCVDFTEVFIIVEQVNDIAEDGQGIVCNDNTAYNLFDFINNVNDRTGTWLDLDNTGINIDDPENISFNNLPPNTYRFSYQLTSTNACPPDTAIASITVSQGLQIEVESVDCATDLNTYTVTIITNNDASISNNVGVQTNLGGGRFQISEIPIDNSIQLDGIDVNGCLDSLSINPPNCDCPPVLPPISNGNQTICEGDSNPSLTVTLEA